MDLFDKCANYTAAKEAIAAGLYPYFHEINSRQDTEVMMDGKKIIMIGSNNYLGLTIDQRVIDASKRALDDLGTGCTGSRFLNGTLELHVQLEKKLAEFVNKESALTFGTGFQSNLAIITGITNRHDYIIIDAWSHASIIDACNLSFAKRKKFEHNDMEDLERTLCGIKGDCGKLIVVDGVFSMEGDICDLPGIIHLAKKYRARVMVDDAHGLGVLGKGGRGTASRFDLTDEVDIIMGTFSKSLASLGGYAASSEEVIHYLKHNSRPFIFSASITPSNAAAAMKALEILQEEPERVSRLNENADYMRKGFKELGILIGQSETPIIPVMTYTSEVTFVVTKLLLENGVYVNPVVSPAVNPGQCLLRTSYSATHTKDQLDRALAAFDKVFKMVKIEKPEVM